MAHTTGARAGRIPKISQPLLRWFRWIVRQNFRAEFHAVRLHGLDRVQGLSGPLMVYANHSGWWDPMVAFLLAGELMASRRHFAPMDAAALRKYKILTWLGVFPVEVSSARGAVGFLRTGEAILRDGGVLWVTPQGRFADVRERPLVFKPGMAALAARVPGCTVLPMAIEYVFWDERTPEALLLIGDPVHVTAGETTDALEERLKRALETVMAGMQERAISRDAQQFEQVLLRGRVGVGGVYGMGKRARAWLTRTPYRPEHGVPGRARGDQVEG